MRELAGRTAFVTGGGSGFGLALAAALLEAGMRVVIADKDPHRLESAARELARRYGARISALTCDVADRDSVRRAAAAAIATFGNVHVLCNNAGVLAPGALESGNTQDWLWSLSVNVVGVVHGIEAFVPHIRSHGEGGHVVNTASMAGLRGLPNAGPYCASKAAVISISESLAAELSDSNIGVTVLCPGFMHTNLYEHGLDRPGRYGGQKETLLSGVGGTQLREAIAAGLSPGTVAARTVRAIRDSEFYVITHPQHRGDIAAKAARLLAAYDQAAREHR
jgi:NAD(P)-dependent dehydrogenase (short-subunit alcohol dehydrogenase family)